MHLLILPVLITLAGASQQLESPAFLMDHTSYQEPDLSAYVEAGEFDQAIEILARYPFTEWTEAHRVNVLEVYNSAVRLSRQTYKAAKERIDALSRHSVGSRMNEEHLEALLQDVVWYSNELLIILNALVRGMPASFWFERARMIANIADVHRYLSELPTLSASDHAASALRAYRDALQMAEPALGPNSLDIFPLGVYNNLSILLHPTKPVEAVEVLRLALTKIARARLVNHASITPQIRDLETQMRTCADAWHSENEWIVL